MGPPGFVLWYMDLPNSTDVWNCGVTCGNYQVESQHLGLSWGTSTLTCILMRNRAEPHLTGAQCRLSNNVFNSADLWTWTLEDRNLHGKLEVLERELIEPYVMGSGECGLMKFLSLIYLPLSQIIDLFSSTFVTPQV